MDRLHIQLPESLKREAHVKAIREGRSLSEVVRELLAQYADLNQKTNQTDQK